MKEYEEFMLESNRIEGEDRINPDDVQAVGFSLGGINDERDILDLHQILGKYLNEEWVGKWREVDVRVGSHTPISFMHVPDAMEKYVRELPRMDSWEAHNEFEIIHPFQDLNGRTGRLIWLSKAVNEGYDFQIPFLQKYYYQTLDRSK